MKNRRFLLYVPVCTLGLPLLAILLAASDRVKTERSPDAPSETPVPALSKDGPLPDEAAMEKLAKEDPISFLEYSLLRCRREIKGYSLTMQKQERLGGKIYPKEVIEVQFKQKPHSVLFHWIQGARRAERALYVEGENNGKMLAHPTGVAGRFVKVVDREVEGEDAKASGRYSLNKFGIEKGTERTLTAWKAAKEKGELKVEYLGTQKIKEAGDRICFKFHRTYARPEYDGVMELTTFFDKENWLQVGSILKGEDGKLIGEYFFRNIQINPDFRADLFTKASVAQ